MEALLKACALTTLARTSDGGSAVVEAVSGGKPVAAMTMGQHVDLVRRLGGSLLSSDDRHLLNRLTKLRNDFVHGRLTQEEGPARTVEFLSAARQLCQSGLVARLTEPSQEDGAVRNDEG